MLLITLFHIHNHYFLLFVDTFNHWHPSTDLAKHFGSDATSGGISKYFSHHITSNAKAVRECVKNGGDPFKDLALKFELSGAKGSKGQNFLSSTSTSVACLLVYLLFCFLLSSGCDLCFFPGDSY